MLQQAPDGPALPPPPTRDRPAAVAVEGVAAARNAADVRRAVLVALAVGVGYFVLARAALLFVAEPSKVAAIWPANGLTLGAMLVARRRRDWAWMLIATFVANTAANALAGRAAVALPALGLANQVEVLTAALGMRWALGGRAVRFATVREVVAFSGIAGVVAAGGAALVGAAASVLWLDAPSFWEVWRLWAVVDALGLLVVTPVIVTLAAGWPRRPSAARAAEAATCLGLAAVAASFIFAGPGEPTVLIFNFPYVTLLPFLIWAGLRFDPRMAALLVAVLVTISGWNTVHRNGPMIQPGFGIVESVLTLQVATLLWGVSALVLSAATAERRAAALALVESERRARAAGDEAAAAGARLQALFDHTTALISSKDRDGRYTHMNATLLRLVGKSAADVLGKTDDDLWPGPAADAARDRDRQVLAAEAPLDYEVGYAFGGEPRVYQATKFPVRDADGVVIGVCVVSTDITARKRDEDQLRAARDQAEQARAQAEDAREQAEEARVQAEEANRAKSEFLANISHEIRTPLTSIFGYADLLSAPAVAAAERLDHVRTIRRNGEHLLAILNDVLDMSKIEAGRMTVERVACPLPPLVSGVMSVVGHLAAAKSLGLAVGCRTPVPAVVQADPTRLRQVLLNVVGNAVKFTEAGRVAIDVWLDEPSAAAGAGPTGGGDGAGGSGREPDLVVEVADTGIGMTAEQVAALGRPFTQADPGHARRFGGSGLGMSISYRLAELMGGSITCRSRPGAGTTFVVRVPAGDVAGVPRVTALSEVINDGDGHGAGGDALMVRPRDGGADGDGTAAAARPAGRVLVAEDSPDTRRLLHIHLTRAGVSADLAENGRAAVAAAQAAVAAGTPYDLVLMDVQMPEMDGLTATGLLRSQGYTGRIVALTANAMEADRRRCLAAGCDGFLTKPIPRQLLLKAVAEYLPAGDDATAAAGVSAVPPTASGVVASAATTVAVVAASGPPATAAAAGLDLPDRLVSEMASDPIVGPLLAEYLDELREKADAIARGAAAGDWAAVGRVAHQIKGSAGGYGYPALTHAAAAVEWAAQRAAAAGGGPDAADDASAAAAAVVDLCGQATRGAGVAG